jgi:hypothetical protein
MAHENMIPEDSGQAEHELELLEDPGHFDEEMGHWMAGLIMPAVDPYANRPPDDPDGGELAKLLPSDIPPNLGSVALRVPEEQMQLSAA